LSSAGHGQHPQVASMEDEDSEMAKAIADSQTEEVARAPELQFPEASIQSILAAGFSRDQATQALRENHGDAQRALVTLLASSIQL